MTTMPMSRESKPDTITIGKTVATSTEIDMSRYAGGSFHLPSTSGTTAITIYAQVGAEAYGIANDEDWVAIPPGTVTAGLPYPLPTCGFNYPRLKLVASTGTATEDVPVFIKS